MNRHHTPIHYVLLVFLCMLAQFVFNVPAASASQPSTLTVASIEYDGSAITTAKEFIVIDPGKQQQIKKLLKQGSILKMGTEIVVPPRTVLVLESSDSNQIRLQPGCTFKSRLVNGRTVIHTMPTP